LLTVIGTATRIVFYRAGVSCSCCVQKYNKKYFHRILPPAQSYSTYNRHLNRHRHHSRSRRGRRVRTKSYAHIPIPIETRLSTNNNHRHRHHHRV